MSEMTSNDPKDQNDLNPADEVNFEDEFNRLVEGDSQADKEQPVEEENDDDKSTAPQAKDDSQEVDEAEKLRREAEYYRHAFDSNRGRVSALQRKLDALERQQQAQPKQAAEISNPDGSGMTDDQWESFTSEYPEVAKAMESKLNMVTRQAEQRVDALVNSRLEQINAEVAPLKQKAHDEFINSQASALDSKFPDWRETVTSDSFKEWIGRQPSRVQELVESDDVQDASWLIETYKTTAGEPRSAQSASKQERLRNSVGVKNKGAGRPAGVPDDYESAFDYFVNQS